jgi:dihydroxyacid dehydratase/phosphogluconate dehydratase
MQKLIQIYTCLLKLSSKQESVTDGRTDGQTGGRTAAITISPHRYRGGIITEML